jgi:hypothetical protein
LRKTTRDGRKSGIGTRGLAASLRRFQPPNVVFCELEDCSGTLYVEFGLSWRMDDRSPAVAAFVDIAREVVARPPRTKSRIFRMRSGEEWMFEFIAGAAFSIWSWRQW